MLQGPAEGREERSDRRESREQSSCKREVGKKLASIKGSRLNGALRKKGKTMSSREHYERVKV